jgi:hypothetical protein
MKKTISLMAMLLLSAAATNAQKWSAGYRTGISQDNFQFNDQFAQGHNLIWNNQVFVNRQLTNRLELELTIGYSQLKHGKSFTDIPESQVTIIQTWETKFLTAAVNIKYYFWQKKNWEAFGSAGLGSTKRWTHYKQDYTGTPILPQNIPGRGEGNDDSQWPHAPFLSIGTGLNYNLNTHLYLSGLLQLTYKSDGTVFASTVNTNNLSPALFIGAGYRF